MVDGYGDEIPDEDMIVCSDCAQVMTEPDWDSVAGHFVPCCGGCGSRNLVTTDEWDASL